MSQWMRSPVPGGVLCSGLFNCHQAASVFCCSSSVGGTVSAPQHVWSSGFRNCSPDDVELTANTPSSCGERQTRATQSQSLCDCDFWIFSTFHKHIHRVSSKTPNLFFCVFAYILNLQNLINVLCNISSSSSSSSASSLQRP